MRIFVPRDPSTVVCFKVANMTFPQPTASTASTLSFWVGAAKGSPHRQIHRCLCNDRPAGTEKVVDWSGKGSCLTRPEGCFGATSGWAGVLELRIRPQETKTKNQPPGVAGIPTTGGTICERTVESRLLLPRSAPLLWWWDQVGRLAQGSHWFVVGLSWCRYQKELANPIFAL
jgi:hypothetical protein